MSVGEGWATASTMGLWHLNDNLNDSSSNGYNLTAYNTPTYEPLKYGKGLKCVKTSSQYASVNGANLRIAGNQTWIGWFSAADVTNIWPFAVSESAPANYVGFQTNGSEVKFAVSGLTPDVVGTGVNIAPNTIHFVAGVLNSTSGYMGIFMDGKWTQTTYTGSHTAGSGAFSIARLGGYAGGYSSVTVDEARVENRAWSLEEIKKYYAWSLGRYATIL